MNMSYTVFTKIRKNSNNKKAKTPYNTMPNRKKIPFPAIKIEK